ncbi:ribonuclease E/G [Alkalihalobacillus sp. CinArs1]|uniref:ribonuclease E/G n=1 Tax=Alkalihalobacillus sp. CinArs1 TaxID=2995314 RepID=UPI0022DE8657|nr:ribonuclease E/G [Alkalihalobacillus sp. CinArs1]
MQLLVLEKDDSRVVAIQKEGDIIDLWIEKRNRFKPSQGDIILGVVNNVVKGKNAAFVSLGGGKPGLLNGSETIKAQRNKTVGETPPAVSDFLEVGQALLVQVKHEGYDRKGPLVTELIHLASDTLVYMPYAGYSAVAKSIKDRDELLSIATDHCVGEEGVIFRTKAKELSADQLVEELTYKRNEWKTILEKASSRNPPARIVKSNDRLEKLYPLDRIDQVVTNSSNAADEFKQLGFNPSLIEVDESHTNIRLLKEKVAELSRSTVKVGKAFVHIESTCALTAIDIDSGGAAFQSIEETHKSVNEAAILKILEQIRLRNISGTILIDPLPMVESDKNELLQLLKEAAKTDSRMVVGGFTKFGLIELQRKKDGLPFHKLLLELD